MKFTEETPLEDIIKHIRESTKSSDMPSGIPIYVDPIGLSEADKTMTSTVRNIDLEGVPLRRTLQLALSQLDLGYFVVDGMLYITSLESAENGSLPPSHARRPRRECEKLEKAERGELTLDEMKDLIEMLKTQTEIEAIQMRSNDDVWGGVGPDPRIAADEAKAEQGAHRVALQAHAKPARRAQGIAEIETAGAGGNAGGPAKTAARNSSD